MKRTDVILSVGTLALVLIAAAAVAATGTTGEFVTWERRYENDTLAFLDDPLGGLSDRIGQTMSSRAKEIG